MIFVIVRPHGSHLIDELSTLNVLIHLFNLHISGDEPLHTFALLLISFLVHHFSGFVSKQCIDKSLECIMEFVPCHYTIVITIHCAEQQLDLFMSRVWHLHALFLQVVNHLGRYGLTFFMIQPPIAITIIVVEQLSRCVHEGC